MRCLNRQKIKIYYSNYSSTQEVVDSSGFYTGEKENNYTTPSELYVTCGMKSGNVNLNTFGVDIEYDMVLISDDVNCPINETSIIWIDNPTTSNYDYVVKGINKSLNLVSYAVKKVK